MPKGFAIAIDGPVAAGKGTIALQLAKEIHGFHLYTGAMYRCVALFCITEGVSLADTQSVIALLPEIKIKYNGEHILLNGSDVTERIKAIDTANGSSVVGVIPQVREYLVRQQQEIGKQAIENGQIVVSEGRDTGTKVFPEAKLKVYLTASAEVRARRRLAQYSEKGQEESFEEMLAQVRERDKRDTGRKADPLPTDPEQFGYFVLDDSALTEAETLEAIKNELRKRALL